jgi:uncharacterized protein (TIRG00374 family)
MERQTRSKRRIVDSRRRSAPRKRYDPISDRPAPTTTAAAPGHADVSSVSEPEAPAEATTPEPAPSAAGGAAAWRWVVGIIVSAFFLWVALQQVEDISHVGDALGRANYLWLLPAVLLYLAGLWVRALRWRALITPVAPIGLGSLFGILSIGFLVNNVLPARLGEIARAVLVGRRHDISRSAVLATIVLERIFDGIVMLLFLGVATAAAGDQIASDWLGVLVPMTAAGFGGAAVALVLLALAPTTMLGIAARLLAPFPARAREAALAVAQRFITGLGVLGDLKLAALTLVLSAVAWLLEAGVYVAVGQAFGMKVAPVGYLLALSVANLGTMIPSSPGYVGTFDALVARSLAIFGVGDALALAYAFLVHLAIWLPPTLIGFFYLYRYNLRLTKLTRE